MEFFRHCPGCNRRFHIKLVSKKLAKVNEASRPTRNVTNLVGGGLAYAGSPPVFVLQEGEPIVIDIIEEFQYNFKCKHCGHEWTENRLEKNTPNAEDTHRVAAAPYVAYAQTHNTDTPGFREDIFRSPRDTRMRTQF